jgi:tripartite-type tricarboxylate transporter receptor subunit TctC
VSWYALYVPARTPPDIVKKMNTNCVAMLAEPAIRDKYATLGISAASSTPEELAAMNKADAARWAPIIKAENIQGE